MPQAMTPQNALRCVARYVPVVKKGSDPFSGWTGTSETVRNKLRTLQRILWKREKHEQGVSWVRQKRKKVAL
jgi:hypothetical protein